MGNYPELWGFILGYAYASVFLIPFVIITADMSDSDIHAFNNVLYVRLSYLYKPPREYLSQGHPARVMKKQDIKCVNSTKIGPVGAWAVVVEDGCRAQLHYNWYHLATVKHVHLILLLLLVVFNVLVSCLMLPILLCVHLMVVLLLVLLLLSMRMWHPRHKVRPQNPNLVLLRPLLLLHHRLLLPSRLCNRKVAAPRVVLLLDHAMLQAQMLLLMDVHVL